MKIVFTLSVLLFIFVGLIQAAAYKGQDQYVKKCVKCHTAGQEFVATKTSAEWKKLMADGGEPLKSIHINSTKKEAKDSIEYFESTAYTKYSRHLKDFLMEYAKDSGRVPACN